MTKRIRSKTKAPSQPAQPHWRDKALEMLPEVDGIAESEEVMGAWIEIMMAFEDAYGEPRNEDLIRRIYAYADWCGRYAKRSDNAGEDPPTSVAVCFYEHIPNRPASRDDMPRWFSKDEVLKLKETFSYHLNPDEFERLLQLWPESQQKVSKSRKAKSGRSA